MPLSVIEQRRHLLVAHSVKCYRAVNVWVVAAYDMARRYINHFVVFVREKRLDAAIDDTHRRPASEEDGALAAR